VHRISCVPCRHVYTHFCAGNNSWLDALRFVPICTVVGMEAVLRFPSYGELSDMGGPGPSLGRLYEEGNAYIRRHAEWRGMARTTHVRLC